MPIEVAEWQDIISVLRETYNIWSPGLDRSQYYFYISRQLNHPWGRGNYRFLVLRSAGTIVAGCKLYTMELRSRGTGYKFGGVAAVYTLEAHRGLGHATKLIEQVIELARREGFDGLYLFSDIGAGFYERLGFTLAGNREFWIELPDTATDDRLTKEFGGVDSLQAFEKLASPVRLSHISFLDRHYRRWLAGQPFAVGRPEAYWSYKISRELFLHEHSRWHWPTLELLSAARDDGYALFEHGSGTLRILEVIGSLETRRSLWRQLLGLALFGKFHRMRGWESVAPPLTGRLSLSERSWGWPMILPFTGNAETWCDYSPCPLLELDHL